MNSEVLIALLSLAGTLIGSFGGIITSSKLTNYRLEQLERKVDKHNGFRRTHPCTRGKAQERRTPDRRA